MQDAQIPARLHVLMARQAPYAVIIRRGPAKYVCIVGWDRRTDVFEVGQWFHGRIYEKRADLSPDGRHLIYFAGNFHWNSETKGTWTAISRAPYIKAVSIWAKGDTYYGGGLFLDDRIALLYGHHGEALELSRDVQVIGMTRAWKATGVKTHYVAPLGMKNLNSLKAFLSPDENAIYEATSQKRFGNYRAFEHYRAGWRLNRDGEEGSREWGMGCNATKNWWLRRPCKDTGYQLMRRGCDIAIDLPPGTSWAEADNWGDAGQLTKQSRVVWIHEGKLFAAEVSRKGMGQYKILCDFNPMTFERIKAPY